MAASYDNCNAISGSIKCSGFLEYLRDFVLWNWLSSTTALVV
jgi:hypothetical protein